MTKSRIAWSLVFAATVAVLLVNVCDPEERAREKAYAKCLRDNWEMNNEPNGSLELQKFCNAKVNR